MQKASTGKPWYQWVEGGCQGRVRARKGAVRCSGILPLKSEMSLRLQKMYLLENLHFKTPLYELCLPASVFAPRVNGLDFLLQAASPNAVAALLATPKTFRLHSVSTAGPESSLPDSPPGEITPKSNFHCLKIKKCSNYVHRDCHPHSHHYG